jgi:hypothetical protein
VRLWFLFGQDARPVFFEGSNMQIGTVKTFFPAKGFGFIGRPGKRDIFFHCSAILGQEGYRMLLPLRRKSPRWLVGLGAAATASHSRSGQYRL